MIKALFHTYPKIKGHMIKGVRVGVGENWESSVSYSISKLWNVCCSRPSITCFFLSTCSVTQTDKSRNCLIARCHSTRP
jgi:hypothetical protein